MGFDDNKFLVIVHLGAGYHSSAKIDLYSRLCENTCDLVTLSFVQTGRNLIEAVRQGITYLENSRLVNAGKGSNKNSNESVEVDASLMMSEPYSFAAIGAAKNCTNPIIEVQMMLQSVQNDRSFSRVVCGQDYGQSSSSIEGEHGDLNDTVGIICVDLLTRVSVIGCSSGGPKGKLPGRAGPCALPGIGFWISEDGRETALCTGVGEQIAIKGGARAIIQALSNDSDFEGILQSLYRLNDSNLEFGFISTSFNQDFFEIFASHSTPSFIFGMKSSDGKFNVQFSSLNANENYKFIAQSIKINS